jgi:flagellar protein FlgJ
MTTINNTLNYNDLASLNSITKMGQTDESEALKKVAQQFESMFVTMMLKSMRDANAVFEEDNPLNSNESKFYRQMFDDQLALSLTQGQGIGLADNIFRQLKDQFKVEGGNEANELDIPNKAIPLNQDRAPNPFSTMRPSIHLPQFGDRNIDAINDVPVNAPAQIDLKSMTNSLEPALNEQKIKEGAIVLPASSDLINKAKPSPMVIPITEPVSKQSGFDSPEQFVQTIWPIAQKVGKEMGVEPKAIISQAALETGWGKYIIHESDGKNSHNLFGIKSDKRWDGAAANVSTLEYRNGVAKKEIAAFRSYDSYEHSLKDYAKFVKNSSRYENAVKQGSSIKGYAEGLQNGGYATDPNYAKKIQRIASGELLNTIIEKSSAPSTNANLGRG